jgi:hypothetical protein
MPLLEEASFFEGFDHSPSPQLQSMEDLNGAQSMEVTNDYISRLFRDGQPAMDLLSKLNVLSKIYKFLLLTSSHDPGAEQVLEMLQSCHGPNVLYCCLAPGNHYDILFQPKSVCQVMQIFLDQVAHCGGTDAALQDCNALKEFVAFRTRDYISLNVDENPLLFTAIPGAHYVSLGTGKMQRPSVIEGMHNGKQVQGRYVSENEVCGEVIIRKESCASFL